MIGEVCIYNEISPRTLVEITTPNIAIDYFLCFIF